GGLVDELLNEARAGRNERNGLGRAGLDVRHDPNYNSVMSNNIVIVPHAVGAAVALVLGAYNLIRRTKGDRRHRWIGRVWVIAMYWTVLSSFAIRELRPGHFSWIHGLSLFTFVTLSIGLWAALTHRVGLHRRFMTGSYLGLVGAFIGAVA